MARFYIKFRANIVRYIVRFDFKRRIITNFVKK